MSELREAQAIIEKVVLLSTANRLHKSLLLTEERRLRRASELLELIARLIESALPEDLDAP